MFDSQGDIMSTWSASDKDGTPTINEISDIYNSFSQITGDIVFTSSNGISSSNELTVRVKYYIQPSDLDSLLSIGFFTGLGRQLMKLWETFVRTPWMVGLTATIIFLGGAFIFFKKTETPIETKAKKFLGIKKR